MDLNLIDLLIGAKLSQVLRVVALFQAEELEVCDSLIFVTEQGHFQLQADVHQKIFRHMSSPDDIALEGDYRDRSGIALRSLNIVEAPFVVGVIHIVSEMSEAETCLIGAFLTDEGGDLKLGINFHLDEADATDANVLWEYVGRLVPNSRTITISARRGAEPGARSAFEGAH